ncbi:hypothetical protein PR202_gb09006 [Eleusine coracana subsp. coracana]|uniref:Uncharacterized protein n=1 Tax=Eleusine coracana subsp. coracana TaxID=191504 RepID=A0AAV5EG66_ELECO|nr:hypothetical protein PR202_gb09006 [Eleusine coracana subsp. coracana]
MWDGKNWSKTAQRSLARLFNRGFGGGKEPALLIVCWWSGGWCRPCGGGRAGGFAVAAAGGAGTGRNRGLKGMEHRMTGVVGQMRSSSVKLN